jgi:hypothetical protein
VGILPKILPRNEAERSAQIDRQLMQMEAKLGGELFGPVPKGHQRQFFCLDETTWIWHEEWQSGGRKRAVTTRYEVRPDGIIKLQDGQPYQRLSDGEAVNLYRAVGMYRDKISSAYRRMLQTA